MPSGGSLTADQWLLLSTVYGPIVVSHGGPYYVLLTSCLFCIQIPQLWSACLPETDGDTLLADRVALIARLEADKTVKTDKKMADRQALKDAKVLGKEAFAAEKARIAAEKVAAEEAKKVEKLKVAAARQAEKARVAAEKKVCSHPS
jgi:hypothetical protein